MNGELQPATKLTIFIGGDEPHSRRPLYQSIIELLRKSGVTQAIVTKGAMSYGLGRRLHSTLNEVTMENLPLIIEAVDDRERVEAAARSVAEMLGGNGLVQMHPTMVLRRCSGEEKGEEE
jgi:PII-like signaling protein